LTDRVVNVRDDAEHNRFLVDLEGDSAQLVYDTEPGRLILVHTEVPDAHQGRGVGGQLVEAALQRARQENLTLVPWCPFARRWLRGHRDDDIDLPIDWTSRPATAPADDSVPQPAKTRNA
jgi:uncharacterized protein